MTGCNVAVTVTTWRDGRIQVANFTWPVPWTDDMDEALGYVMQRLEASRTALLERNVITKREIIIRPAE